MRLAQAQLSAFVGRHLEKRERALALRAAAGSPLYLLERPLLAARADRFHRAFRDRFAEARAYFAVKSNNHPLVAATLLEAGCGLDVSSGRELAAALALGADEILFTGPGKTAAELSLAVANAGRVTLLMDSFRELADLEGIAAAAGTTVRAGVRLCVNPTGYWRKFGIPLADLAAFFAAAARCPHVALAGLQFHTSWNLTPAAQGDFIARLGETLATWPAERLAQIRFLDLGGGYWPEPGEWTHVSAAGAPGGTPIRDPLSHDARDAAPIEAFAAALAAAVARLPLPTPPRICLEPGRWLCSDAMHLLMTVVDRKAPDLVITDAGINAVGWERYEQDYFPVLNLSRPSLVERPCTICGSLCTPEDHFGFAYFGEGIEIGDVLLIPCQGAYTYSLRQEFIKPVPPVVPCDGEPPAPAGSAPLSGGG